MNSWATGMSLCERHPCLRCWILELQFFAVTLPLLGCFLCHSRSREQRPADLCYAQCVIAHPCARCCGVKISVGRHCLPGGKCRSTERARANQTRLNHTEGSPGPRKRDRMPGRGRPIDKRSRDRVTRRAPPLPGGSGVNQALGKERGRLRRSRSPKGAARLCGRKVPSNRSWSSRGVRTLKS